MTREEIEELKGLAASMGLYDDKKPCKRAVILGKAIKALEQEPCSDCISREKALQIIRAWYDREATPSDLKNEIEQLPPITPMQKWIPCSERLPEPSRLVLCHITTGTTETYFLALWNDTINAWEEGIGGYRLLENVLGFKVIEWMPLPDPYKAAGQAADIQKSVSG